MNDVTDKLFVYGTLRKGFDHPAYKYISKYFYLIGEATVQGKLFDLGEYPGAVKCDGNSVIVGELYALNRDEDFIWAMEQLDEYEGVNPEEGEMALYNREITQAQCNGQSYTTWIYWYSRSTADCQQITSGDMLSYIKQRVNL